MTQTILRERGQALALNDKEFVKVYYAAKRKGLTVKQLAKKLGITRSAVAWRKCLLKKNGIRLPHLAIPSSQGGLVSAGAYEKDRIPVEKFIRIHQQANSTREVAEKLGISYLNAIYRALRLRKKGVPLKRFKHGGGRNKYDIEALKKLALSLAPKGA